MTNPVDAAFAQSLLEYALAERPCVVITVAPSTTFVEPIEPALVNNPIARMGKALSLLLCRTTVVCARCRRQASVPAGVRLKDHYLSVEMQNNNMFAYTFAYSCADDMECRKVALENLQTMANIARGLSPLANRICVVCRSHERKAKLCSKCKLASYCSIECQ